MFVAVLLVETVRKRAHNPPSPLTITFHLPHLTTFHIKQCTLQPLQRPSSLTHSSPILYFSAMPYVKKEEWIRRLQEQGENPPTSWTVAQLQGRYAEIMEREEVDDPHKGLEEAMKAMKKASRQKKAEFQRFLDEKGVIYGKTDTVQQLVCKAEEQITTKFEVSGKEVMGFGRHGALTMREVMGITGHMPSGAGPSWPRRTRHGV